MEIEEIIKLNEVEPVKIVERIYPDGRVEVTVNDKPFTGTLQDLLDALDEAHINEVRRAIKDSKIPRYVKDYYLAMNDDYGEYIDVMDEDAHLIFSVKFNSFSSHTAGQVRILRFEYSPLRETRKWAEDEISSIEGMIEATKDMNLGELKIALRSLIRNAKAYFRDDYETIKRVIDEEI